MKKTLAFLSVLGLSLATPVLAQAWTVQITTQMDKSPLNQIQIQPIQSAQQIQIQKIRSNQWIQRTQMDQIQERTDRYRLILLQAFTLAHKKSPQKQRSTMRKLKNMWIQLVIIKKDRILSK